ncbi:hypothetical protein C8Q76DRAFT_594377, partial [Earliella scabrosa]
WTTGEQTAWLTARIPAYLESKDRDVRAFHASTYKLWTEQWPIAAPTESEIAAAGGDVQKATDGKEATVKKRLYEWFYNNCRTSESSVSKTEFLDLAPKRTQKLLDYQAYLRL